MPLYEFVCSECGNKFEDIVPIGTVEIACRSCGHSAVKVMSASSFILKGGGWGKDNYSLASGKAKNISKKGSNNDA